MVQTAKITKGSKIKKVGVGGNKGETFVSKVATEL
jgi:hypothetical protein